MIFNSFFDTILIKIRGWIAVNDDTIHVLSEIVPANEAPPSMVLNIFKNKTIAWVCFIASYDTWPKNATVGFNVAKSDVVHADSSYRFTWTKWIKHAAESSFVVTRLMLLLWTDVDIPPNRIMNLDVLIDNISNLASFTRSEYNVLACWVGLNVNCFEWHVESNVLEGNVSHASI